MNSFNYNLVKITSTLHKQVEDVTFITEMNVFYVVSKKVNIVARGLTCEYTQSSKSRGGGLRPAVARKQQVRYMLCNVKKSLNSPPGKK